LQHRDRAALQSRHRNAERHEAVTFRRRSTPALVPDIAVAAHVFEHDVEPDHGGAGSGNGDIVRRQGRL
jgi:hypothetical protein